MRNLPNILQDEEKEQLFDQFNTRYYCNHRNKLMFQMMLHIGLRVSEVCSLKENNLNSDGKVTIKDGKGQKDRVLWISGPFQEKINTFKQRKPCCGLLFPTHNKTAVSRQYLWRVLKKKASQANLNVSELSPHTLRHTFATDLLRETNNLRLVQKALGHESIETTQIYTHIVDSELEDALKSRTV